MTVGRLSPSPEEQALAECVELTRTSPASALVKGKLIEANHKDNERVLARLAQVYTDIGLMAEATRISQRVEELQDAPLLEVSEMDSNDGDIEWDETIGTEPAPFQQAKPSSLPPPPRPPAKGSLPPPPKPPGSPPPPKPFGSLPPPIGTSPAAEPNRELPAAESDGQDHASHPQSSAPLSSVPPSPAPPSPTPPSPSVAPTVEPRTIEPASDLKPGRAMLDKWRQVAGKWRHPSSLRWWAVGGAAALLLVVFCGYSRSADRHLRSRLADAEQQLTKGTPDGLTAGSRALEGNFRLSWPVRITADLLAGFPADRLPTDVEASILGLEHTVALRLMGQAFKGNLKDAADHAELLGAPPGRVAFARIQYALDQEDLEKAWSLVEAWDEKTANDAYFQLVAGATQTRFGKVGEALERYDRAHKLLPNSLIPLLLAAELAVSEDPTTADERVDELDKYDARIADVSVRALRGLRWALQSLEGGPRLLPEELRLAQEQYPELPERLRYIPAMIRVKEAVIAAAPLGDASQRSLDGAQYPNTILTLGRVALAGGKPSVAEEALRRLREVAPKHPELGRFGLDLAMSTNDLEQARSILKGDATSMAFVEAAFAYERLDLKALKAQLPSLKDKPRTQALMVGWEVQTGKDLLGNRDPAEFEDSVWGFPVQVDAALYRGDLPRAEQLLREWNEPGSSAYLARKAQLSRYQGDADSALKLARRGRPEQNLRAFREELLALVAVGRAKEALDIMKDKERSKVLGPLEKWTQNFVTGKARGEKVALTTIGFLPMPSGSTPIAVSVMAARAMYASGDLRYENIGTLLDAVVPRHPELKLARNDLKEP